MRGGESEQRKRYGKWPKGTGGITETGRAGLGKKRAEGANLETRKEIPELVRAGLKKTRNQKRYRKEEA